MADLYAFVSLVAVLGTAFLLTRAVRPRGYVEAALWLTLWTTTLIVLLGYAVSERHVLREVHWWALGSVLALGLLVLTIAAVPALRAQCFRPLRMPCQLEAIMQHADKQQFSTRVLIGLALVVALVSLGNLLLILGTEPSNYDALSYHISRIAVFLQANTLNYYGSNYWGEVVHPKVATVLMLYTFLVSGQQINMVQLVQYLAYFVTIVAIYGITRHLGATRQASLFAALLFGLLTITIAEAASAQNDLVMAAMIACTTFGLVAYRTWRTPKYLVLAALAFALAAGVKATAASFAPSLAVLAIWAVWPQPGRGPQTARHLAVALAALAGWVALITLPAGYLGTQQHFGNALGPADVRKTHAFGHMPPAQLLQFGQLNLARYAIEFVGLDGMPGVLGIDRAHTAILHGLCRGAHTLGLDVTGPQGARRTLGAHDSLVCSEDRSYWGILGILLIWPVVLFTLFAPGRPWPARLFALATLIAFVAQAFLSPYDWYRGRYFMTVAIFALPTLAFIFPPQRRWLRGALAVVLVLGGVSALTATCSRQGSWIVPLYAKGKWIAPTYTYDRSMQLTRQASDFRLLAFDSLVPEDAVIAVDSYREIPITIFYGDRFSRRIIAISPSVQKPKRLPIPPEAYALVYDDASPYYQPGDIPICQSKTRLLGTIYLRLLHPTEKDRATIQLFGGDPNIMCP